VLLNPVIGDREEEDRDLKVYFAKALANGNIVPIHMGFVYGLWCNPGNVSLPDYLRGVRKFNAAIM
jgi:hypothetical protein